MRNANLRAAQVYAHRFGWPVLPLVERGKEPIGHLVPHGYKSATLDWAHITKWYHQYPHANIGVACDARSKLLALDVDTRSYGDCSLDDLEDKHGKLPDTVEAHTGGGGRHLLFKRPDGICFRGQIAPGVEIKANGYIVAPPSVHPCGNQYEWEVLSRPGEVAVAEMPPWLLAKAVNFVPESEHGQATDDAGRSLLARAFEYTGSLGRRLDSNRICVRCPWQDEHTVTSGPSSTVLFAPTVKFPDGRFHCSHAHCSERRFDEVLSSFPVEALRKALADVALNAAERGASDDALERIAIVLEGE